MVSDKGKNGRIFGGQRHYKSDAGVHQEHREQKSMKGEERMDGKENFKKMLKDMVGESIAQDMEEAGKQLARATRGYYMALIDEGFTKAQAIHFTDLFLAGIIGRIG